MADRVRIVNTGGKTGFGTEVWINGEKRTDVMSVTYTASATEDPPTATVVFCAPEVDVAGEVANGDNVTVRRDEPRVTSADVDEFLRLLGGRLRKTGRRAALR